MTARKVAFICIVILYLAMLLWGALTAKAQERFGDGAIWVHHRADGSAQKYRTENGCWHAHYSQEVLTGSYCEPEKKWVMIEQSKLGVDTTGFKSEFGCFMSGVIASHQQGIEASCRYLGETAGR